MIVQVTVTNAEGNVTAFVHSDFDSSKYSQVAQALLSMQSLGIEQVAFIKSEKSDDYDGWMEMAGLEFCGNATRAFGLVLSNEKRLKENKARIKTSGISEILNVDINPEKSSAKIKIPTPRRIFSPDDVESLENLTLKETLEKSTFVEFDGIFHVIALNADATKESSDLVIDYIKEKYNPSAVGIMYYDKKTAQLTPIVHVCSINSTKEEGSCCSGTTALAYVLSQGLETGDYTFIIKQPGGMLKANVLKDEDETRVYINSKIEVGKKKKIDIKI